MGEEQIELMFRVPDEDFDFVRVDVALRWLEEQVRERVWPELVGADPDVEAIYSTYLLVWCVRDRYADALEGRDDWKRAKLDRWPPDEWVRARYGTAAAARGGGE